MSYRRGFLGIEMAQNSVAIPTFKDEFTKAAWCCFRRAAQ